MSNSSCFAVLRIGDAARDGEPAPPQPQKKKINQSTKKISATSTFGINLDVPEEEEDGDAGLDGAQKRSPNGTRVGDDARLETRDAGFDDEPDFDDDVDDAVLCAGRDGDDGEGTTRPRSDGTAPCRRNAIHNHPLAKHVLYSGRTKTSMCTHFL